jgi:hypothetical protein
MSGAEVSIEAIADGCGPRALQLPLTGGRHVAMDMSYPVFTSKSSTHRMHDPGSIVPHIRPKVLTDNQMS